MPECPHCGSKVRPATDSQFESARQGIAQARVELQPEVEAVHHDWRTNRNPDFAFCQKHFLTYSLNRYEVVKKKPPEKGSIRLIVNCPICFHEGRERMRKLTKTTTKSFSASATASI